MRGASTPVCNLGRFCVSGLGASMASWRCSAAKDLPINTDTAWDRQATRDSVFAWAGWPDNPDPAKARRAFLVNDADAPELMGSYKLGIARYADGRLEALASGLRQAASRLPQTDNLSSEVQDQARAVLDGYFAKLKQSDSGQKAVESLGYFRYPARILTVEERAQAGSGDSDLLALMKKHAADPSIFDEHPPVMFSSVVSTSSLDSYFTQMHRSSLENFAEDLNNGISLLDSHDSHRMGIGYSLRGRYVAAGGNGVQRAVGDFFSIPGSPDTDAFILKMRAGMVRDMSAGFFLGPEGKYVCQIDQRDPMECGHWPGFTYMVEDKPVKARAMIHGAHLAEASAVYDGSTPGAGILGLIAQRASEAGMLTPEIARQLETCYRIKLPASRHAYSISPRGPETEPADLDPEEESMPETPVNPPGTPPPPERSPEFARLMTRAREVIALKLADGATPPTDEAVIERLIAQAERVPALDARILEQEPLVVDGRAWRQSVVDETWSLYVSAGLADGVVEADQKATWTRQPITEVVKLREMYRQATTLRLGGGRQTTDGESDPNRGFVTPPTPAALFRA